VIAVLIPTFGRASRLADVVQNAHDNTAGDHVVVLAVESEDHETISVARGLDCQLVINERRPNYSGAITTAYEHTRADYLFAGADDLNFHPGWDEVALSHMDGWVMVVGTNDLLNPYVTAGTHATHYLVDRRYLDEVGGVVDQGPGSFLFDGYSHQYTDTEFIGTAKMRARFRPCFDSIVEHMHAWSDKPGRAAPDATTSKANARITEDAALYDSRRDLWFSISR
jgi:glycosyltransferase involved in cell wall biosynthesis